MSVLTMVRKLLLPLAAAIGFIFGENVMAIEEPGFERLEKIENFEIRQYRPVVVAETFVDGDLSSASNIGFRRIADYIFGNNRSMLGTVSKPSEKIAMTAPVLVEPVERSEKIAMTAPVSVEPQGDSASGVMQSNRWRVQFTMPSEYSKATLPTPVNPEVSLRDVPGKRFAVNVFSGFSGEERVQQKIDELFVWLDGKNIKSIGAPQLARYNPPWTLPFWRRNEILVEISAP